MATTQYRLSILRAIKSLDCLNDQIVQFIVTGQFTSGENGRHLEDTPSPRFPPALSQTTTTTITTSTSTSSSPTTNPNDPHVQESMVLIRRLLVDAQAKFRSMVEDNRELAAHIDGSIRAANQEVGMLRSELASTSKRLSQISLRDSMMAKSDAGTQAEQDSKIEDLEATIQTLKNANQQLMDDYKKLLDDHDIAKVSTMDLKSENEKLSSENVTLKAEYGNVVKENGEIRLIKADNGEGGKGKPSYGELKLELIQTRQELSRAKEVLQEMKSDRKRLKGEKLDLLSQMKQLYATLEDKETELRDFIKNYEQRVRESDDMIKQLAREKEETDHEKWDIITKARDAAEKAMFFKAQLDMKEQQVKAMETDLAEAKRVLGGLGHSFPSPTLALSTSMGSSSTSNDNNNFLMSNSDSYSISSTGEDSCLLNFDITSSSNPGILGMKGLALSTPIMAGPEDGGGPPLLQRMASQTSTISEIESDDLSKSSNGRSNGGRNEDLKKKKKNFSGFSRIFNRSRLRRSVALTKDETIDSLSMTPSCAKLSVLNEDNYQEKLSTVEHMVGLRMEEWRAHQVLAWLEITLAMPMYAIACLHNIKSGKVLLGLSDSELSAALGVSNHMHRRKLRLSIEQHRNPDDIKYSKANEMDPTWIAHRFLPDLGLPQYTHIFEEQLCDGHIINTLTRRDLEKYFSVHRKFHQSSIMHAVELLRRIDFNKEKLYKRRNQSDEGDTDLIVWTNERIIKWIRSIDLGEYSDNLQESGVHGAMLVLEPSFCADSLSSILGIPPSKSYIRRHLDMELDNILKPARTHQKGLKILRAALDTPELKVDLVEEDQGKKKLLQRGSSHDESKTRLSFRGSIGKAFGMKLKSDLKKSDSDASKRTTISGPIPIQHSSLSSLDTNSDLLKKGFCVPGGGQATRPGSEGQGSESDLQKSFHALASLQKQRALSEDKITTKKSEEKLSRPTVVDLVKDLKKETTAKCKTSNNNELKVKDRDEGIESRKKDKVAKSYSAPTPKERVSSLHPSVAASDGEASLVSSSSQDTLTEHSVLADTSRRETSQGAGDGLGYDRGESQTESLSQSSSTESSVAVEEKIVPKVGNNSLRSSSSSGVPEGSVRHRVAVANQSHLTEDGGSKPANAKQDSNKRSSFKEIYPHSTPV